MKKYLYIIVVFLVALSCERVNEESLDGPDSELVHKVFTAVIDGHDQDTKTVLDENSVEGRRSLMWEPGDEIGVATNGSYFKFTNIDDESSTCGRFEGDITHGNLYYAVYPYRENMWMTAEQTINLPSVQTYREGSFDKGMAPMVGRSYNGETIAFMNLCGVLSLSITGTDVIKSISFTAKDENGNYAIVCGDCTVDMNYTAYPVLSTTSTGGSILMLDCGEGVQLDAAEPTLFHLVLPPATYHGFSLVIATADGKFMEKSSDKQLTISRSVLTKAGTFGFEENLVPVNLSERGHSNCYIVSEAGAYSFDADVIGNGKFGIIEGATFHTENISISPAFVELLWEDYPGIIKGYVLDNAKLKFVTSGNKGNALLAARDSDGNILWSWHIWVTDRPNEQTYVNSTGTYQVLDRNLGAIRADNGTGEEWKESIGTLYQWGRKDPFVDGFYSRRSEYGQITINESVLTPTVVVRNNYVDYQAPKIEWMTPTNNSLWTSTQKTIYDPCPMGYTVAPKEIWSGFTTAGVFENGWNFIINDNQQTAWYPLTGHTHPRYSSYDNIETHGYLWSSTNGYRLSITSSEVNPSNNDARSVIANPVRCAKETGYFDISYPEVALIELFDITATSVGAVIDVLSSGISEIVEKGVIVSENEGFTDSIIVPISDDKSNSCIAIGLNNATKYYIKAYATNSRGTTYSESQSFITLYSDKDVDLSADGTSNCYIVPPYPGCYSFDCSVKGNSDISIVDISTAHASIKWTVKDCSEKINRSDLIKSVQIQNNRMTIELPASPVEGNALIAACRPDGQVLWSWHVWITDQPEEHHYVNSTGEYYVLDRNIGATRADCGSNSTERKQSYGFLYQWGRKDPFAEGHYSYLTFTGRSPYSIASSIQNPTFMYVAKSSISGSTWTAESITGLWDTEVKTMYDPCPVGYKVADKEAMYGFTTTNGVSTSDVSTFNVDGSYEDGWNFIYDGVNSAWYPTTKYHYVFENSLRGDVGYVWTSSREYRLKFSESIFDPNNVECAVHGHTVRCQKIE